MAARKTRVNFTLSPDNVRAAQEICEERGLKLSTFVDRAIASYVKQLREPPKAPASPPAGLMVDLQALTDKRIRELFPEYFLHWFERYSEAQFGKSDLKAAVLGWIDTALEERETLPQPSPETAPPEASTPKASPSVDVPPEVVERLRRFTARQVAEASGLDRTSVTRFRSGSRSRVSEATLNRLLAGLEKLEERS